MVILLDTDIDQPASLFRHKVIFEKPRTSPLLNVLPMLSVHPHHAIASSFFLFMHRKPC